MHLALSFYEFVFACPFVSLRWFPLRTTLSGSLNLLSLDLVQGKLHSNFEFQTNFCGIHFSVNAQVNSLLHSPLKHRWHFGKRRDAAMLVQHRPGAFRSDVVRWQGLVCGSCDELQFRREMFSADELFAKWINFLNELLSLPGRRFPYFLKSDHFHGYFKFSDETTIVYKYIASVDRGEEIKVLYNEVNEVN